MKNLAFFSSLLVIFALSSCGGNDDTPSPGQEQVTLNVVFDKITVGANYNVTLPNQTTQLVLSANKDKISYVKTGEVQYYDCYVLIEGLNAGESLTSLTINLIDGQATTATTNFGKIDANQDGSPVKRTSNAFSTFLDSFTANLATKKSATLQIILNGGNKDVSNLKITVHVTAVFKW